MTINFHHTGASAAKLKSATLSLGGKSEADDFNSAAAVTATGSFLPGTTKNLGGTISGAVSIGVGASDARVVAAVVNDGTATTLRLVDALTLADLGTGTLTAPTSGRPAFGSVGGTSVVAVGTDDGNLAIFKAEDATAVGAAIPLGAKVSTPAIDNATGNIYVGAETSGGVPKLHLVKGGASASSVDLEGTTVGAAPAFVAGGVAVGTDTKLFMLRSDGNVLTPQSSIPGTGFTAPVIFGDSRGLAATGDGTVYQFDLTTGTTAANTVAAPAGAAPFSEGFPVSGGAIFGGTNGSVYQFNLGANGPAAGTVSPLLAAPISAAPISLGGTIYAIDNVGNLKSSDGVADVNLGGPSTKALGATGATAGTDSLIVATTDGGVTSLPF